MESRAGAVLNRLPLGPSARSSKYRGLEIRERGV